MSDMPAFPQPINPSEQGRGMTLRDYFAASALQGLIADTSCNGTPEDFAIQSFEMADSMMKAREA